jgi:hypothetical protein
MKKILIIGCVLMGSFMTAMSLPEKNPNHFEKTEFNENQSFCHDQVFYSVDHADFNFVLETETFSVSKIFFYVPDIVVVDKVGFYKPIEYEKFTNSVHLSDLHNARIELDNELLLFK